MKKLTQTQVAKRLNLSKASISGYETNVKYPSTDVLVSLANFYGVSVDFLLGLEPRSMVSVEGLTPSQKNLILTLIDEFRSI